MDYGLKGKVAIVTGSGSGIGRATAIKFAQEGSKVAVVDINAKGCDETVAMIKQSGGAAIAIPIDLMVQSQVQGMVKKVIDSWGQVDVLANVAGYATTHPFVEETKEYWDKVVGVCFWAVIFTTHAVLPHMMERRSGVIVNVSSDAARVGTMGEAVYSGAKGGVVSFTKSTAREGVRYNIRCNCICPGPTRTPLLDLSIQDNPKAMDKMIAGIPMKRVGEPEEQADAILYFASERSSYITGQVLSVSGGLTMSG